MKKCIIYMLLISLFTIFSGCEKKENNNPAYYQCDKVLEYLSTKDKIGLKSLFCEEVKNNKDFDAQLENVINYFDGKIISHDNYSIASGDEFSEGKLIQKHASPIIYNVKTDTSMVYTVSFFTYIENEDTNKIGITLLGVKTKEFEQEAGYFIPY